MLSEPGRPQHVVQLGAVCCQVNALGLGVEGARKKLHACLVQLFLGHAPPADDIVEERSDLLYNFEERKFWRFHNSYARLSLG